MPDAASMQLWEVLALINVRTVFTKTGRAKYISHLDLMRCMTRALKRSSLPVWYTEGFNPHAYIMFPLALSLGTESRVEIMDFNLIEDIPFDEIKSRLNAVLPENIQIVSAAAQISKHTEIAFSRYTMVFESDVMSAEELKKSFADFMAQQTIEIEKKTKKKGISTVDIRPYIDVKGINIDGNTLSVDVILPSGIPFNLNANAVSEAYNAFSDDKVIVKKLERTAILNSAYNVFA